MTRGIILIAASALLLAAKACIVLFTFSATLLFGAIFMAARGVWLIMGGK